MSKSEARKTYVARRADELGIPVVDGVGHVHVVVTESDVANAKKANSKHCALARAALRLPGVNAAYFFRTMAFLEYEDRIVRQHLPVSVQKEIVSFDRASIFASGDYQLSPVSPSDRDQVRLKRRKKERRQRRREQVVKAAPPSNRNVGSRTVSSIRSAQATNPLLETSPTRRYVHRTQYIRDLKEPKDTEIVKAKKKPSKTRD